MEGKTAMAKLWCSALVANEQTPWNLVGVSEFWNPVYRSLNSKEALEIFGHPNFSLEFI